jgi:hypothetical protein
MGLRGKIWDKEAKYWTKRQNMGPRGKVRGLRQNMGVRGKICD